MDLSRLRLHFPPSYVLKLAPCTEESSKNMCNALITNCSGNPLEALDGYRQFVLGTLPSLKQLDFSSVTKQDRADAENWKKLCSKKMKMSKKKKPAE